MRWHTETDAVTYIFSSLATIDWKNRGLDEHTRNTAPTLRLLQAHHLLDTRREYAVVTGSKGKGSVTAITAHLLKSLGHTVGMITSPHLVSYRERIRVNGRAIPLDDFLRLIDWLAPSVDRIQASLPPGGYLSPQGIFLAMALRYFDEMGVTVAVIEVGRGGRYDDNALVPNQLSLFTPIILEHTRYLGDTLERIAWHKSGIIKPQSYAYSLPQAPEVMHVLRTEAERQDARFEWIAPVDMGELVEPVAGGLRVRFSRYGEVILPFYGHYEIDNATLAIVAAGNIHARLDGVPHSSPEYVERIRHGLETVVWHGRCQKLSDAPLTFVDGAINTLSFRRFWESVRERLHTPPVVVAAVPRDRDYPAVYRQIAEVASEVILTQTARNVTIHFPDEADALATMRSALEACGRRAVPVSYAPAVAGAIEQARARAGAQGAVLLALAQPAIGDLFEHEGLDYEQI